jgi:divalent metal cation (Fe/Co/Zn/Cd) transporter
MIAAGLLVAATIIIIQSIREILDPGEAPALFTLFVLIAVVAVKEALFRFVFRTGEWFASKAMQTDAGHRFTHLAGSVHRDLDRACDGQGVRERR